MTQSTPYDLLQNTTARVIYYSCLSASRTIPEVSKFWGYRSAAYFYQSNSRELLKGMMNAGLIISQEIGKGREQLSANYEVAFQEADICSFFNTVNTGTEIQLVMEEHPEIGEGQLDDPTFREYCLNREPELKKRAARMRFDKQATDCLTEFWKHSLFKQVFLPVESLSKAFHRTELPGDPKELVFEITCALCEKIFEWEKGKAFLIPPFMNLFLTFDVNEMLPPILDQLDLVSNPRKTETRNKFNSLTTLFTHVYEILKKRIGAYEEMEDISSYHIRRFVSLIDLEGHLHSREE